MNLLERRRALMMAGEAEPYLYEGFVWGRCYSTSVSTSNVPVSNTTATLAQGGPTRYKNEYVSPYFPVVFGHTYEWPFDPQGRYPKEVQSSDWGEAAGILFSSSYSGLAGLCQRSNGYPARQALTASWASQGAYVRVASVGALDDFYFLDVTTGEYLFKGKNLL